MIDFDGMIEYFKPKEKQYFIHRGDIITHSEFLKLREIWRADIIKALQLERDNPDPFLLEVKCKCGAGDIIQLGRSQLIEYLRKSSRYNPHSEYICDCCKEVKKGEKRHKKIINESTCLNTKIEKTREYCNIYLDPNMTWNKGVSLSEKWSEVKQALWLFEGNIEMAIKDLDYHDFLQTLYWKTISLQAKRKVGFRCELCNSNKDLKTHHKTYEHHGQEHNYFEDLIVLCGDCHAKFHDKLEEAQDDN